LHYRSREPGFTNAFDYSIKAVGEVLAPYKLDGAYPVLGFGAKVNGERRYCFPLVEDPDRPQASRVESVLARYHHALNSVELAGPTNCAQVVRWAHEWAETQFATARIYTVLLIITDGVINDLQDTIAAIVDAERQPLSIVIIGLGVGTFAEMAILRANNKRLSARGVKMARDTVHFATFRNFRERPAAMLGAEALVDIPRQFVEWADQAGVHP
jgi:hypothetical protein